MFIDLAKVYIAAGKGGNGAISFRREIYIDKGGPDGGDGGKGGDVVFLATTRKNTLVDFRFQPKLIAKNGANGAKQKSSGKSGEDLVIEVPVGTVVKKDSEIIADLTQDGQRVIIAKGGEGGRGNWRFKSSVRQTPRFAELGTSGEAFMAELELKLIADVGLLGFPNAGKSTFISAVTSARPEIADYPFTTLSPHLGVAKIDGSELLIADIPGIIDGAAMGKGLGFKFLRHVERCKVLLHLIDVYTPDAGEAYAKIRHELRSYSEELAARPEIIALSKTEGVDQDIIDMQIASIKKHNPKAQVLAISSVAHQNLQQTLRALLKQVRAATSAKTQGGEAESQGQNSLPVITLATKKQRSHHQRYEMRDNRPVTIEDKADDEAGDDITPSA